MLLRPVAGDYLEFQLRPSTNTFLARHRNCQHTLVESDRRKRQQRVTEISSSGSVLRRLLVSA